MASSDVQGVVDEMQLVEAIINSLQAAGLQISWLDWFAGLAKQFRRVVKGGKVKAAGTEIDPGADGPGEWKEVADRIQQLLGDHAAKHEQLLVAVDELPIFLARLDKEENGPKRVANVLHWLRAARQAGKPAVRWVVCGSVGLDSFVESRGLVGTVNDFQIQTLGAYDDKTAVECLQKLGASPRYNMPLSEEACRLILDRVGWPLPYYLQLMFHALIEVRDDGSKGAGFPTAGDVETAFGRLLDPHQAFQFSHWDTRLDDQFSDPADAGDARFLLKRICRHPQGIGRDVLLADLVARKPNADAEALERSLRATLMLLERDGYLLCSGSDYAFRSFLLRAYWERRFA